MMIRSTQHVIALASILLIAYPGREYSSNGKKMENTGRNRTVNHAASATFIQLKAQPNDCRWIMNGRIYQYDFTKFQWEGQYSKDRAWLRSRRLGPKRNRFLYSNISFSEKADAQGGGYIFLTVQAKKKLGAEIISNDSYFHFGRYEVRMRVTSISGCVNAFFIGDHRTGEEIDIEFLSSECGKGSGAVHIVIHPHSGYPESLYHRKIYLNFNPAEDFHRYCIQWSEVRVDFFVDDTLSATFRLSDGTPIPVQPGRIYCNTWTGHPWWGGGPPIEDATMAVDWIRYEPAVN